MIFFCCSKRTSYVTFSRASNPIFGYKILIAFLFVLVWKPHFHFPDKSISFSERHKCKNSTFTIYLKETQCCDDAWWTQGTWGSCSRWRRPTLAGCNRWKHPGNHHGDGVDDDGDDDGGNNGPGDDDGDDDDEMEASAANHLVAPVRPAKVKQSLKRKTNHCVHWGWKL